MSKKGTDNLKKDSMSKKIQEDVIQKRDPVNQAPIEELQGSNVSIVQEGLSGQESIKSKTGNSLKIDPSKESENKISGKIKHKRGHSQPAHFKEEKEDNNENTEKAMTYEEIKSSYELLANEEDFELFWFNKVLKALSKNGLLVL